MHDSTVVRVVGGRLPRDLAHNAAWCAGYLVVMVAGRLTLAPDAGLALFWPAAGVAVIWFALSPGRTRLLLAPAFMILGTLAVSGPVWDPHLGSTLLFAVAHSAQALLIRLLLARRAGVAWHAPLEVDTTTSGGILLLMRSAVLATAATAPVATYAASLDAGDWNWLVGATWIVRNATADLVIAGAFFQLAARRRPHQASESGLLTAEPRRGAVAELLLLTVVSAVVTAVVFGVHTTVPVAFLLVTTVIWTGARFTPVVVSLQSLLFGGAAVLLTLAGRGVFAQVEDPLARSITIQLFLGVTTLAGMLLAASTCERQQLARTLAEANERFNRVATALDDYIWSVELFPDGHSEIAYTSGHNNPFTGGPDPDESEDHWLAMARQIDPDHLQRFVDFGMKLARGEPADVEVRIHTGEGHEKWIWVRGVPRTEGSRTFVDGITTDVSQRMALDDLRNQFLAIAGHELRTPLTVIRGYAETLAEAVDNPEAAKHAAAIERRAYQLEVLIDDFFDLATFQSGQVRLDRSPVQLHDVIADVVRDHAPVATERSVQVRPRVQPATVLGDAVRLRQVVDNLVENAIKYNTPFGSVLISCRAEGDQVVLEVEDTGIGVPPAELSRLFERFFRASNGQAHTISGTGLGLAVVKAIVEAHDGSIQARSNAAGGLTMELRLPVAETSLRVPVTPEAALMP